jgi:hypothetical protein
MAHGPVTPAGRRAQGESGNVRSLVIRAWLEPGTPHLRVRIVDIRPGRSERPVTVTSSADEACRAVRRWLEALEAPGGNGNGDGAVTQKGLNRLEVAG